MPKNSILSFDKGTLILHPPPKGKNWIQFATWDERIEKFRIPAINYRDLMETLESEGISITDYAKQFLSLDLISTLEMSPFPHQIAALQAWKIASRKGVVVLPTGSGKTYLAQLAMESTPRSTLIIVPTLDLMHQWYANLQAAFPDMEIGLLGGGARDRTPILIATYDSAAINAETLGNQYALLIFDECHHLPTDFYRVIAEFAIAPYRLGLTATPERSDFKHEDLDFLIGKIVFRQTAADLAGSALADHKIVKIKVKLSQKERQQYDELIKVRNDFLRSAKIALSSLKGWQQFVMVSAQSTSGRKAMLAHREAREIALGTEGKLRILTECLSRHYPERMLIFTTDNATVYKISQKFLIPAITHQTPIKERHEILNKFKQGEYKTVVASHVLNEGVDVPDAKIAIILSGTGSQREYIQRLGRILRKGNDEQKQAILYEVITEDTSEESTSERRSIQPQETNKPNNLYQFPPQKTYKAAEKPGEWNEENDD